MAAMVLVVAVVLVCAARAFATTEVDAGNFRDDLETVNSPAKT